MKKLKIFLSLGLLTFAVTVGAQEERPWQEVFCKSTASFLNDVLTTNLNNYLDDVESSSEGFTTYWSRVLFPRAVKTMIRDTNMFQQDYRAAEAILREEWRDDENLTEEMKELYAEICEVYKVCLVGNGFEYNNKDDDQFQIYKLETDFTRFMPVENRSIVSNLQTPRGMLVHLRVTQNKLQDGTYHNRLYVILTAQ